MKNTEGLYGNKYIQKYILDNKNICFSHHISTHNWEVLNMNEVHNKYNVCAKQTNDKRKIRKTDEIKSGSKHEQDQHM